LRPHYLKSMEETLVDIATVLSSSVETLADSNVIPVNTIDAAFKRSLQKNLNARIYNLYKKNMNLRVYITDTAGIVLYDSDNKSIGMDFSRWNDVYLTLRGQYGKRSTRTMEDDPSSSVLYIGAPIIINEKIAGVLTVSKSTGSVGSFIDRAREKILIVGTAAGLTVFFVGLVLTIWVTGPIRKLTKYALNVKNEKVVTLPRLGLLSKYGHSEVGVLGAALEDMKTALEGKKYVEQYVQTLTHEIKSPLSAIRGASELLSENPPDDKKYQFLGNIVNESKRIQDIIDRLLQLSSLENRTVLKDPELINVSRMLDEIIESMIPAADKKRLYISVNGDSSISITGEVFLIRQALANLIQNAIDFSGTDGEIIIHISKLDKNCVISIKDQGTGIPEYAIEKIFERFYSLPRPDTKRKSSGLGLSFVHEVAALHGGSIRLVNNEKKGACAILTLPG
ncbi:MAG: two-component system sensor histidine kinase CreC, partial [Fibrobacterota bacterium]|nr:two-component system sensor histidine kinase CreC [Chitinispirillaceae bacterium]